MFSTLITVALFVSLAIRSASASFAINTPQLIQCEPVQISWAPYVAPYTIDVVRADDPCGEPIHTFTDLTSTTLDYAANITSGTVVTLFVVDADDNTAWSGNITVGPSSSNTCVAGAPSIPVSTTTSTPVAATTAPSKGGNPLGGAINAAPNSGAPSVHQASTPLLSITALAAMLALAL